MPSTTVAAVCTLRVIAARWPVRRRRRPGLDRTASPRLRPLASAREHQRRQEEWRQPTVLEQVACRRRDPAGTEPRERYGCEGPARGRGERGDDGAGRDGRRSARGSAPRRAGRTRDQPFDSGFSAAGAGRTRPCAFAASRYSAGTHTDLADAASAAVGPPALNRTPWLCGRRAPVGSGPRGDGPLGVEGPGRTLGRADYPPGRLPGRGRDTDQGPGGGEGPLASSMARRRIFIEISRLPRGVRARLEVLRQ